MGGGGGKPYNCTSSTDIFQKTADCEGRGVVLHLDKHGDVYIMILKVLNLPQI